MNSWLKGGAKGAIGIGVLTFSSLAWGVEISSREKQMGIGGRLEGRDCPGVEIVWKPSGEHWGTFFRGKPGKDILLGVGMAIFSPDCRLFWFTSEEEPKVHVFESKSGRRISTIVGLYPAWSPDSSTIYVSRKGKKYQLWRTSVIDAREQLVHEVSNFHECPAPGDGIDWYPVTFDPNGHVRWTYATTDKPPKRSQHFKPAKSLLISVQTRQILNEEWAQLECEYADE